MDIKSTMGLFLCTFTIYNAIFRSVYAAYCDPLAFEIYIAIPFTCINAISHSYKIPLLCRIYCCLYSRILIGDKQHLPHMEYYHNNLRAIDGRVGVYSQLISIITL